LFVHKQQCGPTVALCAGDLKAQCDSRLDKMLHIFVIFANFNLDFMWTTICGRTLQTHADQLRIRLCGHIDRILFHWFSLSGIRDVSDSLMSSGGWMNVSPT
jgi:hypothetical protein